MVWSGVMFLCLCLRSVVVEEAMGEEEKRGEEIEKGMNECVRERSDDECFRKRA